MIEDIPSFTDYWTNARARTTRVLDRLPEPDLEWSHAPGRFTFGDLAKAFQGPRSSRAGLTPPPRGRAYRGGRSKL